MHWQNLWHKTLSLRRDSASLWGTKLSLLFDVHVKTGGLVEGIESTKSRSDLNGTGDFFVGDTNHLGALDVCAHTVFAAIGRADRNRDHRLPPPSG